MNDDTTAGAVSASEWRQLRRALTSRLQALVETVNDADSPTERSRIEREIAQLQEQVQSLAVEESVAKFVEDAERYIIMANTLSMDLKRDPDEEIA